MANKFIEGDTVEIISTGEVGRIIGVHKNIYLFFPLVKFVDS